jgi:predicted glycosyltransferase
VAAATVSQGGYNTTLEIVRAGVPALVVPYATPEEDEQLRRARRLERLGALRVLEHLDPAALAREIRALRGFEPTRPAIDLDGGHGTCQELWDLIRGGLQPALLSTGASP